MTPDPSKISTQIPGISTQTLDEGPLFSRIQSGHMVITANSRLSRVLKDRYNHWRIQRGDRQWKSPEILSWELWLNKLWESASLQGIDGADRSVPGERQLISLWESTLKTEPLAKSLLRPEALATQLRDTRKLLSEWLVALDDPSWFGDENENHTAFQQWNRSFDRRCQRAGWIEPNDRYPVICSAITDGSLISPPSIDLIGFDELSPARLQLLKALIKNKVSICLLNMTSRQHQAVLWKAKDSRHEIQQMARWVRYWYEKEPQAGIAIVVPDLHKRRGEIDRVLAETLCPGSRQGTKQPWNISIGTSLMRVPMVETAFDLLNLLNDRVDIQDIGRVLRSPWLPGAQAERNSRAFLEKCIRENYPRQLKLGELLFRASEFRTRDRYNVELPASEQQPQTWNSPQLHGVLRTLSRFKNDSMSPRPASSWAESFDQLLVKLGWPSTDSEQPRDEQENSETWQALQSWREALRELASLDATDHELGRRSAINRLKQICREKVFQVRTAATSIQVLGLYEISALRFDHVWVVGLHNDNWPGSAKPNPFIPGKLQRAVELPNASPQRELDVARTITKRLLETAPDCVFSYPGQLDGEDLLPSPLLTNETIQAVEHVPCWQGKSWLDTVAAADKPELRHLERPGPVQHATARGGSTILKHQALCPFRAFAVNRLGAEVMETPVDGISPALHGSLVHTVLEYFWKETKTQAGLLQLDQATLTARVWKHVNEATSQERGLKLRPAFLKVEANRVHRHVMAYLELETQRDPFEVTGFEKEMLPEIGGQPVRLFIDRIDRLPSGEEVIIDYKTGKVEPGKWFGERPEDPQLPLYAISAETTPAAVCFGILRDDGCLYKGVVMRPGLLPGLPPDKRKTTEGLIEAGENMSETIGSWRQILHRLMAEFLSGEATVDPKSETTCDNTYCDLHSLCRIGELRQRQQAGDMRNADVTGTGV